MFPVKVYIFSEQGHKTPIKMDGPGDPASRTASRLLTKLIQPQKIFQPRLNNYPDFSQDSPKLIVPPDNRKQSIENNAHIPKDGLWMFIIT